MGENGESPRRVFATTHSSVFGPPAWSPDEKRIAFVTATQEPGRWEATMNIRLLDLSTGHQEVIVSPQATNPELDASAQFAWRIVWTADNHLVYAVTEPPPNQTDLNLWQVPLDSIGHVAAGALRLTATPGGISHLSASANGTQIVYTKSSETPTIYLSECVPMTLA
jgi:Tol biopolymer transport system component